MPAQLDSVYHIARRFVLDKWGGTEAVVYNYSTQMKKNGISNHIYTTNIFCDKKSEDLEGVKVHRFSYIFPWLFLSSEAKEKLKLKGGSPLSLSMLFHLLFGKKPSVIHTHVQHRLGGIARTVAKFKKIPYVVSLHGNYLTLPKSEATKMMSPFKGKLEWGKAFGMLLGSRKTISGADAVICVDRNEYEKLQELYPNNKIVYFPNGVEIEKFQNRTGQIFREQYGIKEDEKYILCLSRIDFQKNQRLLVKSFVEYSKSHPNYKLVIAGPITVEDYHRDLLADIQENALQDKVIIIPGFEPQDQMIAEAYAGAEFFVLPSRHEPFGIVILEAWAAGTPVIASRLPGIEAFSHDQQDILHFNSDDDQDLLSKMNHLDNEEIKEKIIANSTREVKNYSWKNLVGKLQDLYCELIENKGDAK
jgi:glycosyltransferase involved in cell wall biosynthesis